MNDAREILVLSAPGEQGPSEALAGALGAPVAALEPAAGDGAGRVAEALVAAERLLGERAPDALVLCGSGPEAGAAALVAAKLGVPTARVSAPSPGDTGDPASLADLDGPVAERLAGLVVPGGGDPEQQASAIRAWLASYTSSP
jgi:hypothetical protein